MDDLIKCNDALLPCPFCKGQMDDMGEADDDGYFAKCSDGTLSVQCSKCGTIGPTAKGRAEAIAAWNTRALPALTPNPVADSQPADPVVNDPAAIREAALSEAALRIGGMIRGHDKTEYEEGYNDALATAERHILALIGEKK